MGVRAGKDGGTVASGLALGVASRGELVSSVGAGERDSFDHDAMERAAVGNAECLFVGDEPSGRRAHRYRRPDLRHVENIW